MKYILLIILISLPLRGEKASHYHFDLIGDLMANQDPYDPLDFTCASWDHEIGTLLQVTSVDWDMSVIVLVTDRHDFLTDIDLSFISFTEIAPMWWDQGVMDVTITEICEE